MIDKAMLDRVPVKSLRMRERMFREFASELENPAGLAALTDTTRSMWSKLKHLNKRDRQRVLEMIESTNSYIESQIKYDEELRKTLLEAADACRAAYLARSKPRTRTSRQRTRYSR